MAIYGMPVAYKSNIALSQEVDRMDNDDRQIGRILSRREVLALLGTAGATLLIGCGPSQPTAGAPTAASGAVATPALNAEAATAVSQAGNPSAAPTAAATGATVAAGNAT